MFDRRTCSIALTLLLASCLTVVLLGGMIGVARATFSIVAVDPSTGEVGSAGASCIAGSLILSDVHPGVGGIHTQAYWNAQNQAYAGALMDLGLAPEAIIDSLVAHDAGGNPTIRQYGIVDLVSGGRSAGYTGVNCDDYKGHLLHTTAAIAGNILLGPEILADMEAAYLGTPGPLAMRLMATLQAANVPGADTRCLGYGKPAISAFIRVARPGNPPGGFYLDLNVSNTVPSRNPIDLLQDLFDQWLATVNVANGAPSPPPAALLHPVVPNPLSHATVFRFELRAPGVARLTLYDVNGRLVSTLATGMQKAGLNEVRWQAGNALPAGVYFYRLEAGNASQTRRLVLIR
jgi:uncharacterized Ntn-hydrolase superfamily protein